MPTRFVKQKMNNARNRRTISPAQRRLLLRTAANPLGFVTLPWHACQTARCLERFGYGDVIREVKRQGWGLVGWCFVVNEAGMDLAEHMRL